MYKYGVVKRTPDGILPYHIYHSINLHLAGTFETKCQKLTEEPLGRATQIHIFDKQDSQ